MKNFHWLDFLKTSFFWSQKHSFSTGFSKKDFCGLICPKKQRWWKVWFFDKNCGLTPLENFNFLVIFKTSFFWPKKHPYLSRMSRKDLVWLDLQKNKDDKKFDFSTKTMEKFDFLDFLKVPFSDLKSIPFYPNYQKTIFSG